MLIILLEIPAIGQLDRYWDASINAESGLMGGSVVAGKGDVASAFYNPASISRIASSKLSVNASVVSWQFYSLENVLGPESSFKDDYLTLLPRAFSYMFKPKKSNRLYFEFVSLLRNQVNFSVRSGNRYSEDFVPEIPGDEIIESNIFLRTKFENLYFGAGLAYNLNENWSIGASLFFSVKSLQQELRLLEAAIPTSDSFFYNGSSGRAYTLSADYINSMSMSDHGLLGKFGLNYMGEDVSAGIVVSTPSVGIITSGYAERLININNLRLANGELTEIRIQDWQNNLNARYKDPWSLALGLRFYSQNDRFEVSTTAEYFFKIKAYELLDAEIRPDITDPAVYESLENKDFLSYAQAADDVLNLAIGFRYLIAKSVTLYGGFRSDFNARSGWDLGPYEGYNTLATVDYDLFHSSLGTTFHVKKSDLLLGVQYTFGAKSRKPALDPGDGPQTDNDYSPLESRSSEMVTQQRGLAVFIGASFNFMEGNGD